MTFTTTRLSDPRARARISHQPRLLRSHLPGTFGNTSSPVLDILQYACGMRLRAFAKSSSAAATSRRRGGEKCGLASRRLAAPVAAILGLALSAGCGAVRATSASTTPASAAVASAAAIAPEPVAEARKKAAKKRKKRRKKALPSWHVDVETALAASGGALKGKGALPVETSLIGLDAEADVRVSHSRFRLDAPIRVAHRETQGADLSESRVKSGAELSYRPSKRFRIGASAQVAAVWRPDWPDLYQPMADGQLLGSDRKSFWRRTAGAEIYGRPIGALRTRAEYEYSLVDYRQDPTFDAVAEPNHLVPSDHGKHTASLSWRYWGKSWKLGGGAEAFSKNYAFAYARDAGTGRTHATSDNPNPLQKLRGVEPSLDFELELFDERLELDVSYGYEIVEDAFQGYYSYTGHHPEVRIAVTPSDRWKLVLSGDLKWRRYGPGSYAEGSNHPALTFGDRRVDRRASADLRLRRNFGDDWGLFTSVELDVRRTNFPDYEPGVFPSTQLYDIDWNYENWLVVAGVEFRQ